MRNAIRSFFIFSFLITIAGCGGGGGGSSDGGHGTPHVAPTITSTAPPSVIVNTNYVYDIAVTGNPTPMISVAGLPPWLTFNGTTISGTSTSSNLGTTGTITVTAENGVSPAATQTFQVTVNEPPTAPHIMSTPPTQQMFVGSLFWYEIRTTPPSHPNPITP